jgi:hypothetical protein
MSNPKDRSRDNNRVIDLQKTRLLKELTGQIMPIPAHEEESPEMTKHVDEALELGNSGRKGPKLIAGPGWMGEDDAKK